MNRHSPRTGGGQTVRFQTLASTLFLLSSTSLLPLDPIDFNVSLSIDTSICLHRLSRERSRFADSRLLRRLLAMKLVGLSSLVALLNISVVVAVAVPKSCPGK